MDSSADPDQLTTRRGQSTEERHRLLCHVGGVPRLSTVLRRPLWKAGAVVFELVEFPVQSIFGDVQQMVVGTDQNRNRCETRLGQDQSIVLFLRVAADGRE